MVGIEIFSHLWSSDYRYAIYLTEAVSRLGEPEIEVKIMDRLTQKPVLIFRAKPGDVLKFSKKIQNTLKEKP